MLLGPGVLIAGRYIVERKIGEGSWGEVWLGHHARVGMRVAIKALLSDKASSHDANVRFSREAKFLGRIQSDYVARVLDFVDDDTYGLILVMELVEGDSLSDLLRAGPIAVERAIEIGHDLVAGLCDLHAARVVHRDLKPGNVILRPLPDGRMRAVIIDFSLGRLLEKPGENEPSITQLTGTSMSVGTLPYMAPEQVLDSRKVTFASDVYAVGALLWRCIAGRYVFDEGDENATARKKLTSEAPPLETGRADPIAKEFERVVARAIRRRPEDRYPDAHAMLAELTPLRDAARARAPGVSSVVAPAVTEVHESTEKVLSPAMPEEPPVRGPSRAMQALAAASLVAIGVVAGLTVGRLQARRAAEPSPPPTTTVAAATRAPEAPIAIAPHAEETSTATPMPPPTSEPSPPTTSTSTATTTTTTTIAPPAVTTAAAAASATGVAAPTGAPAVDPTAAAAASTPAPAASRSPTLGF